MSKLSEKTGSFFFDFAAMDFLVFAISYWSSHWNGLNNGRNFEDDRFCKKIK